MSGGTCSQRLGRTSVSVVEARAVSERARGGVDGRVDCVEQRVVAIGEVLARRRARPPGGRRAAAAGRVRGVAVHPVVAGHARAAAGR